LARLDSRCWKSLKRRFFWPEKLSLNTEEKKSKNYPIAGFFIGAQAAVVTFPYPIVLTG
jgi:hypothetical protein